MTQQSEPSRNHDARPLHLKGHYRSGRDNLGKDFFAPCISACTSYKRGSGFFTSRALATWAAALPRLARSEDISIQLLIAPRLSEEDKGALRSATDPTERLALQQRCADDVVSDALRYLTDPAQDELRLELFRWLVANGRLIIRFAYPTHVDDPGMFHEKLGVFAFAGGEKVAFTGSANETASGHSSNYESVDVYRSWEAGDGDRVRTKEQQFDEAWVGGEEIGLKVLGLTSALIDRIRTTAPDSFPRRKLMAEQVLNKWRHQDEAIKKFLGVRAGVLEMATGTGKTRTALRMLETLLAAGEVNGAIVCTVGNDLLEQWVGEVYGLMPARRLTVYKHFHKHHDIGRFTSHPAGSVIVVSRGALPSLLQRLPALAKKKLMIIHDEVHGLGSPSCVRNLEGQHQEFVYRLGLSATPEREFDEVGTQFIHDELGDTFFKFGLAEAIERGILCEFSYVPLDYSLTEGDKQRITACYAQRAARKAEGRPMPDTELWRNLAAVYKTAEEKPSIFAQYLNSHPDVVSHVMMFVHSKDFGDQITDLVHRQTSRFSTYYDGDHKDRLVEFSRGELDCLITCHRLSQGIDIRHVERIVLFAADRAKLETIQRIGRCLRVDPTNPRKRATVIDFIRQSEAVDGTSADEHRRNWLVDLAKTRRQE